jgi:hypothetical protein
LRQKDTLSEERWLFLFVALFNSRRYKIKQNALVHWKLLFFFCNYMTRFLQQNC